MTAALEGGEWSEARLGRSLPPGKTGYPFYRRLSGPQGQSGRSENLVPTGIRSRTVQPVVSRYTNWATRPTHNYKYRQTTLCEKVFIQCRHVNGINISRLNNERKTQKKQFTAAALFRLGVSTKFHC